MALTDFDAPPPGYAYSGQYNPDGSLATKYIAGGILPQGYNTGAFNPDGSLSWASSALQGGPAVRNPLTIPVGGTHATPNALANASSQPSVQAGGVAPRPIDLNSLFQNKGPTQMFASQRSQPIQQGINQANQMRTANNAAANQSLTDFTRSFLQSKPKVQQYSTEEQNAISQMYGTGPGTVEGQLAMLNRQQQAATNQAAQSAMNRASRENSVRRMMGGDSSYLDRLFGQNLSNIAVGAAGQAAGQGRADLQYLQNARQSQLGRRQQLIDSLLARDFAPVDAANRIENMNMSGLQNLAGLEYGNNVYAAPEDAYSKRLNFLQSLMNQGYA